MMNHLALVFLCAFTFSSFVYSAPVIVGKPLNPDISVGGLFSLTQFNKDTPLVFNSGHDPKVNGFNLQQMEISFQSNVDPYFRADIHSVFSADGIELEEAYGTTLALPGGLQVKAGQFFTAFGRNNPTHPHTWDFANKPIILGRFFGGDGMRNPGAQISWLTPLPWFSEVIISGQSSTGNLATSFRTSQLSDSSITAVTTMRAIADLAYLFRTNHFVSLSEEWSLNLGGSYLTGPNAMGGSLRTDILGGDLYLKYRNPSSLSFVGLQLEALRRLYAVPAGKTDDWGWYTQLIFRLPEPWQRWHLGIRYDWASTKTAPTFDSGSPGSDPDSAKRWRVSPVVTFYPSEFSKVRLQYDYDTQEDNTPAQHAVSLQFEFLIGAHGAHQF